MALTIYSGRRTIRICFWPNDREVIENSFQGVAQAEPPSWSAASKHFRHGVVATILWLLVSVRLLSLGKLDLLPLDLLVGNQAQKMGYAVNEGLHRSELRSDWLKWS